MSAEKTKAGVIDPSERSLYRAGSVSAFAFVIGYVAIIILYVFAGVPPAGGESWLKYAVGKTAIWWGIIGLSIMTDFLLVPIALSLYISLKGLNRNATLLAVGFVVSFVILDLAVTWPNYSALVTLSGSYAAATSDAQRAAYLAAANYATSILASGTEAVYSILTLSIGILVASMVMLRGVFRRSVAYVGLVTGILGIVSVVGPVLANGLGATIVLASLLTAVWVLLVGFRLYGLGRK